MVHVNAVSIFYIKNVHDEKNVALTTRVIFYLYTYVHVRLSSGTSFTLGDPHGHVLIYLPYPNTTPNHNQELNKP